jgi:hypothetical protein
VEPLCARAKIIHEHAQTLQEASARYN